MNGSAAKTPDASVVVVSYNTSAYIGECIEALLALDYPAVEIIVVDNASSDGSIDLIKSRFPHVELVELPENKGFAGGASVGLFMARGDIVATVNPDVRLDPGWMRAVADTLAREDVGIVGSRILYPDGVTIQHAGGVVHYPLATTGHIGRGELDRGQYNLEKRVSFVTGAALAMRREVGHLLNFFDEEFFPMYYEDVDLCWRAEREGLQTVYQPQALAYHRESVTVDRKAVRYYGFYHANRLRFVVKNYSPEQLMGDFLPAEAARLTGVMEPEDRKASLSLFDEPYSVEAAPLHSTRPAVIQQHHSTTQSQAPQPLSERWDALQAQVSGVMSGWQVYEKAYGAHQGKARRKGSMRDRLRNIKNRLYLWPVLQKQIDYNAELARTVRELSAQLADVQARLAVQSSLTAALLSRRDGELDEDLAALDE
jgi:O-antigen biosynthesis protein